MAAIARRAAKASSPVISRLERVEKWVDISGDDELKVEEMRGCLRVVSGVRKESALQNQQSYPLSSHILEVFLRS